jgi:uncharacterized membrane protein YhhN
MMAQPPPTTAKASPSNHSDAPLRGQWLLWAFAAASLLNLIAVGANLQWLIWASKPTLMLWLAAYVALNTTQNPGRKRQLALFGLLAACAGDTFLMLQGLQSSLFLAGLGSFLLTHVAYTWLFSLTAGFRQGLLVRQPLSGLPLVFYWIILMLLLWPGLPAALAAPVAVYGLVITAMALSAYHLRPLLSKRIYQPLIVGALLFLISDSLIGLSRFRPDIGPIWQPGLLIMATYIGGQYLIATQLVKLVRRKAA